MYVKQMRELLNFSFAIFSSANYIDKHIYSLHFHSTTVEIFFVFIIIFQWIFLIKSMWNLFINILNRKIVCVVKLSLCASNNSVDNCGTNSK